MNFFLILESTCRKGMILEGVFLSYRMKGIRIHFDRKKRILKHKARKCKEPTQFSSILKENSKDIKKKLFVVTFNVKGNKIIQIR